MMKKRQNLGFTLLEVLVSMVILSMMIVVIGNMYQQVSDSWNIGVDRAEILNSGRGALELMARELSSSVCSDSEQFMINSGQNSIYGLPTGELRFAAMLGEPNSVTDRRAVVFVEYYVRYANGEYEIMRNYGATIPALNSKSSARMMIQDAADLQFFAYDQNDQLVPNYDSTAYTNQLPAYVDIYLEVLGSVSAKRAKNLAGQDRTDFVNRNAKRFSTRVYFNNRNMDY